jgi:hypothetical protein
LFTVGAVNQTQTSAWLKTESVYAAGDPETAAGRKLRLKMPAEVAGAKLNVIYSNGTTYAINGTDLPVPAAATSFRIDSSLAVSQAIAIPETPDSIWSATFTAQKSNWYGLRYALGVHSAAYNLVTAGPLVRVY